jgi:hypothetical protein
MPDIYVPAKKGERIRMPGGMPDWPEDGQPVDFTVPYQSRLVADGTLVKKKADKPGRSAGEK